MDARSPWYGMYLYGVESLGSLWGLAALQALILSFSLEALYRRLAPARGSRPGLAGWLGVMAGLCVFSTLPFFVGFAMPDVFIGSGLIGLFLLIARWRDLSALERAAHLFLVFLAFAFHRANGPVLLGAGGLLCLWLVFRGARPVPIRPAASVIGLFLAALALSACNQVYSRAPLVSEAHEAGDPEFRPGLWLISGYEDRCAFDIRRPLRDWPDCAVGAEFRRGQMWLVSGHQRLLAGEGQ